MSRIIMIISLILSSSKVFGNCEIPWALFPKSTLFQEKINLESFFIFLSLCNLNPFKFIFWQSRKGVK